MHRRLFRYVILFLTVVFFLPVACVLGPVAVHAQDTTSIDLRGLAAFRPGDDDVWRSKYIDEEMEWSFVTVPGAWEDNGFPLHDGFGWYRLRFRIPTSLRDDSLLLVCSGIDDADETFLNGIMVGKTGDFPPSPRSEPRSLRVYPLPRFVREEFNLLAVRVHDTGDRGGITGSIFRIVRADSMHRVLDEIVDERPARAPRFISNGVMVSRWDPDSAMIEWSRPRLADRIATDLPTEIALTGLRVAIEDNGVSHLFIPDSSEYLDATGVLHAAGEGLEVYWYHPRRTRLRVLVVAVRQAASDPRAVGLRFVMERPSWRYEQRTDDSHAARMSYHILAYHSCCPELAERDMEEFLAGGTESWSLHGERSAWVEDLHGMRLHADVFSDDERRVYRQSLVSMRQLQVREPGLGEHQCVSGLSPSNRAVCEPAAHLLAVEAFAAAGLCEAARSALDFIHRAQHDTYTLFDVYGKEFGVGYPYLVTPAWYDGGGGEWRWEQADRSVLRYEGMARYVLAVDALRACLREKAIAAGEQFSDSTFLAAHWTQLGPLVADVLMYRMDSTGLLSQDDGPWGVALSDLPGIHASILASHALRIAARHARILDHELKAFLYAAAAERTTGTINAMINEARRTTRPDSLSGRALRLFHPLLIDAITVGMFAPDTPAGRFALDVVESGFAIEDAPDMYRAGPGGDWFARQARPQITLRLARAYAVAGRMDRAERLFAAITREALRNDGLLPELIDPVLGGWHGAMPSLSTAADYILTAEAIARRRLQQ
ncbi:MAG: hypothetical protein RBU27_05555 [Bacteroidota bacterium]|jgi:hypothetical protein|nr:hypothetical protein [Bacteroidota bacterium]